MVLFLQELHIFFDMYVQLLHILSRKTKGVSILVLLYKNEMSNISFFACWLAFIMNLYDGFI